MTDHVERFSAEHGLILTDQFGNRYLVTHNATNGFDVAPLGGWPLDHKLQPYLNPNPMAATTAAKSVDTKAELNAGVGDLLTAGVMFAFVVYWGVLAFLWWRHARTRTV